MKTTKITLKPSATKLCAKGNSIEERQLLNSLLRGRNQQEKQRRWNDFVRRYERLITSCVLKVLRRYGAVFTSEDLDDLVGDVWLTLLRDDMRKLRQYDESRGFRIASFIGLVATNTTIDHLRARQAQGLGLTSPLDDILEGNAAAVAISPRDNLEVEEQAELARRALDRLSSDERAFVVECFHAERSPEELARRLGVTTNTVYSRKFKIREKLARIVSALEAAA
jgi:RNA polymerase sigma factor (sigma-70 family)